MAKKDIAKASAAAEEDNKELKEEESSEEDIQPPKKGRAAKATSEDEVEEASVSTSQEVPQIAPAPASARTPLPSASIPAAAPASAPSPTPVTPGSNSCDWCYYNHKPCDGTTPCTVCPRKYRSQCRVSVGRSQLTKPTNPGHRTPLRRLRDLGYTNV